VKASTLTTLRNAAKILAARDDHEFAIRLLTLDHEATPETWSLLAASHEKCAEQIEQTLAQSAGTERDRGIQLVRDHLLQVAAALEAWLSAQPAGADTADALARLGKARESLGQTEQAMVAYQRLHEQHGESRAAQQCAISLAQLYIAKGGPNVATAQKVLAGAVESPDPAIRRTAMLESVRLLHRTGNFKDALPKLEQFAKDFATDERLGEVTYLAADCSMQLALQLEVHGVAEANAQRKGHLAHAAGLYERVAAIYRATPPTNDADRQYQKLAMLRRADCAYERGEYEIAVKMYEEAAKHATEDVPQALAANVQIANAYFAMGRPNDARQATERAKQVLTRLPAGASGDGSIPMPASYMQQWLKWSTSAATW
jgi:tetratricopeptide (TPR) repeat protein